MTTDDTDVPEDERRALIGDSAVQRGVEAAMALLLADQLGVPLAPAKIKVSETATVELDAASEDRSVLVEAFARHGLAKSGQRRKILTDAFKLAFTARAINRPEARLVLLFADEEASRCARTGWAKAALDSYGIEVIVVELSAEIQQSIRAAQDEQYR